MSSSDLGWNTVTATHARRVASGVLALTLESGDAELPEWEAGAHIDVELPSGLVRQYSLCGHPGDPTYTIAILREDPGRGGSIEIHETQLVGKTLRIRGPRNNFALEPAENYVFLAGGIGITPIIAMAREAAARGVPWSMHYGGRSAASMAFTDEARAIAEQTGSRCNLWTDERDGPLPLEDILGGAPADAAVYACGPPAMLCAVRDAIAREHPGVPLRTEQFAAADDAPSEADGAEAASFEVELARTGQRITVDPGATILDAVRQVRPEVMSSCEEGFCGTCETKVLAGEPVHRDTILNDREREKNTTMMICVGGCSSTLLVLDL